MLEGKWEVTNTATAMVTKSSATVTTKTSAASTGTVERNAQTKREGQGESETTTNGKVVQREVKGSGKGTAKTKQDTTARGTAIRSTQTDKAVNVSAFVLVPADSKYNAEGKQGENKP